MNYDNFNFFQENILASIVHSEVRAFTEKFPRPTIRFLQVALYFLLLILITDSCFALCMRLYFSAPECAHLMWKILLGVGSSEMGMSTNIVPITLQLPVIVFFPSWESFHI